MSVTLKRLDQTTIPELATTIRNAGIAGAGGAGFPAYAKWERLDEVDYLLMNHQESEPNFYIDKWLGRERAAELATLFDALLAGAFEVIVVCAKEVDRDLWMRELEAATDATIRMPAELPLDPSAESGVVFAYTDERYEYGMESVLLRVVADTVIGKGLPMDHGWIVQNTETLYNIYRTLVDGTPMIRKYVHVDGNVPRHRFLDVPVGTPASVLLNEAGRDPATLEDELLADGGPGWCFKIEVPPDEFGVSKRTNCVFVLDADVAVANTLGGGRINVLGQYDRKNDYETEPTRLEPEYVSVPMISNAAFEGVVNPSMPIVETGDRVEAGEMIATPSPDGFSNAQHASIDGTVTSVTDAYVEIRQEATERRGRVLTETDQLLYWTWCVECGSYVAPVAWERAEDPTYYVCDDCR